MQHLGHLEEIGDTGTRDSRDKARGILQVLKTVKFVMFLNFLMPYLDMISAVSKVFQDNDSTVEVVFRRVDSVVKQLTSLAKPEKLNRILSNGIEERGGSVVWKDTVLHTGRPQRGRGHAADLATYKKEVVLLCQGICDRTLHHLGSRFEVILSNPVFSSARVLFQFSTWPTEEEDDDFGDDNIRVLHQHFHALLQQKDFDIDSCIREWVELKSLCRAQLATMSKLPAFSTFWMSVLTREQEEDFKHIFVILRLVLVIPIHTAECERSFSLMNVVKSDWRTRLDPHTLTSLMAISLDNNTVSTFDPLPAVGLWWAGRRRRPSTQPYGARARRAVQQECNPSESDTDDEV
ncbi:PREDICTED: zinc finger protein 862-like [Branchiostoma belcheri]|uniref:Zinc finger protein 862-like n=1 Tax=Branchiostoma belcheri TaxID=7741 RepID=A0A6P4YCA8_BRABE|nr:PREDICTED: zinc finger protein 862-like [Branchiostoma belcheri]